MADPADILNGLLSHIRVPSFSRTRPGAPPGTLMDMPEAAPEIRALGYGPDKFEEWELEDIDELPEKLEAWDVVWLDVEGVGDASLLEDIGELFGFPMLAMEDVQNAGHRPKAESYEQRVHVVLKMPHWRDGHLEIEPVSLFVGPGFVVTFQLADRPTDYFLPIRQRIVDGRKVIRSHGSDYLAYAIMDRVIDAGFPVLQQVADTYFELEAEVTEPSSRDLLTRIHALNSQLLVLRRSVAPHRELLRHLYDSTDGVFSEEVEPFLKDCLDHAVQISELGDNYHAQGNQILSYYLSIASHRQNEITTLLTIIATIFIPLTFIAGIYGMNFNSRASKWNMPELDWAYGYPGVLLLMFGIGMGLMVYFWRKGWIGRG